MLCFIPTCQTRRALKSADSDWASNRSAVYRIARRSSAGRCFEFSRQQAADQLSAELDEYYAPAEVPALRLAWTLNPSNEFRADPILAELAAWATTVVKVPLKDGTAEQLSEEISQFDESFNLFAPHVRILDLVDGVADRERHFKAAKKANLVTLTTEDGDRDWLVVSTDHRPSLKALESAGHAAKGENRSRLVGPCP